MEIKVQVLDCDYILTNGKPIVRIFGKNEKGETICVFFNGILPYFYLHCDEEKFDEIAKDLQKKFGVKTEIVEKIIPIGFHPNPVKMLKIIGTDPSKIPEIRDYAKKYGTPYEADILFKYRVLVDKGIYGMSWIKAKGRWVSTTTVKCKAFEADEIIPEEESKNAPLKYLSIDIECMPQAERLPDPSKDPIVIISMVFYPPYKGKEHIVLVAKPFSAENNILGFENEKQMLEKFVEILLDYDPDIILGYNILNFDFPYLIKRLEINKVRRDIGRCEKLPVLKKLSAGYSISLTGRVIVDPYDIIKKDVYIRLKRYDLNTVAKYFLNEEKIEIDGVKEMKKLWNGTREDLLKFTAYCKKDAELALRLIIEKDLLEKFFELSKISGLLLQDVFGGQSQRHECKLLHEFKKRNMVLPCKPDEKEIERRKEERKKLGLKGAIVLDPKVGLHNDGCILVLDFASLYPSIIRTFNICPTTLLLDNADNYEHITSPTGAKFVAPSVREGVFPAIVKELIETRKKVKKQMKEETDPEKKRILDAKQHALKIMANSLYGYLGFLPARLYLLEIANSITAFGRENILKTKELVENNFPVEIVYGDTDSIFVKTKTTDLEEAEKLGNEISEFVSSRLPGYLTLEFEKIFKSFLILTKKRYAGWKFERDPNSPTGWKEEIEMKGIETVRRDWCSLTSETMEKVIKIILKEGNIFAAAEHVRNVIKELSQGKVPLEKLTIVKSLTKPPEEYDGVQPHVELAKKLKQRDPTRAPSVGDRIEFVIVKGNQMLSKRAEDPKYVIEKGLEIDANYYIENQILPPIERIFEVCGITKAELLEGSKQQNLFDFYIKKKPERKKPEELVLDSFEGVVCFSCKWSFRRPLLSGICPRCGNTKLYFEYSGSAGAKAVVVF